MSPRMAAAKPPFPADVAMTLDSVMRGEPPLSLFTTLARDSRLFRKFMAAGLLDDGHLTLRQREIVVARTTALCSSEYEWGVHAAVFARAAGLTDAQLHSTVTGGPEDPCWAPDDAVLIALSDALHSDCDIPDSLWAKLQARFSDEAILELLMLAGFYRTVSCLTNGLRLPLDPRGRRFPGPVLCT